MLDFRCGWVVVGDLLIHQGVTGTGLEDVVSVVKIELDQYVIDPRFAGVLLSVAVGVAPDEVTDGRLALRGRRTARRVDYRRGQIDFGHSKHSQQQAAEQHCHKLRPFAM